MLSGGVDSILVAAAAADLNPFCFTVAEEGSSDAVRASEVAHLLRVSWGIFGGGAAVSFGATTALLLFMGAIHRRTPPPSGPRRPSSSASSGW